MNRTQRLLKIGLHAKDNESASWWAQACIFYHLYPALSYEVIAEEFGVSDDSIRNAARAYDLFCQLRARPDIAPIVREYRRKINQTNWSIVSRFWSEHGSLADALLDLQRGLELPSRELEAILYLKYKGHPAHKVMLDQGKHVARLMADVWSMIDGLPESEQAAPMRLAKQCQADGERWVKSVEELQAVLSEKKYN